MATLACLSLPRTTYTASVEDIETRLNGLESLYHQHIHSHSGVFEWSGAFDLSSGTYTWPFLRLGSVYGANDTTMHVALLLTDETAESYENDPSPGMLDGDELEELAEATGATLVVVGQVVDIYSCGVTGAILAVVFLELAEAAGATLVAVGQSDRHLLRQ